jgi:hypothetical protein
VAAFAITQNATNGPCLSQQASGVTASGSRARSRVSSGQIELQSLSQGSTSETVSVTGLVLGSTVYTGKLRPDRPHHGLCCGF